MQKQKITKRQTQAIKTRNKIYKVSIDLMEKKGFENFTIEEISKKAGVSVGAFYHYFKSKNDILAEVFKRADDYFKTEAQQIFEKTSPQDQIITFFSSYAEYNMANGIDTTKQLYNPNNKSFIVKGRYMQCLLEEIISKGQENNELSKVMTPQQYSEYLFIIARGIIFDWCLHEGQYDLAETTASVLKPIIRLHEIKHS